MMLSFLSIQTRTECIGLFSAWITGEYISILRWMIPKTMS
jgi:hypothetical protein